MNIVPWRRRNNVPVRHAERRGGDLLSLQHEIDRVFDRFWQRPFDLLDGAEFDRLIPMPSINVNNRKNEIVITAETPGMSADDVEISITDRVLTISGEKRDESEKQDGDVFHAERRFGSFSRSIELPPEADPDSVEATERNGVLTIRVGKRAPSNSRRVEVRPEGRREPVGV